MIFHEHHNRTLDVKGWGSKSHPLGYEAYIAHALYFDFSCDNTKKLQTTTTIALERKETKRDETLDHKR